MGKRKGNKSRLYLSAKRKKHRFVKKQIHCAPHTEPSHSKKRVHRTKKRKRRVDEVLIEVPMETPTPDNPLDALNVVACKTEKYLCRCCHSEGLFESLREHRSSDTQDVVDRDNEYDTLVMYSDMLQDCFGIQLSTVVGLDKALCAICDACIQRLQDAAEFKQLVQESETLFQELYLRHVAKVPDGDEVEINDYSHKEVKEEPVADNMEEDVCVDDFGGSSHGDEQDLGVAEEHKNIPQVNEDSKLKKIKIASSKVEKEKIVVRPRKQVAPPKDEEIVDTTQEEHILQAKEESKPKKHKIASSKVERKKKVVRPRKQVAPQKNEEIVDTTQGEDVKKPTRVEVTKDIDYKKIKNVIYCCRCEFVCKNTCTLRSHVKRIHFKIPPYRCSLCPKTFYTLAPFVMHKLDEHKIDERFKCNACDKSFCREVLLRKHKNEFHMLGVKIKCNLCDYECFRTNYLKRHMQVHDSNKNFHCKFCQKSFKSQTNLRLHEMIHTGDKRKVCKECGQAFVQKASLNYHMTKYHPEVNFYDDDEEEEINDYSDKEVNEELVADNMEEDECVCEDDFGGSSHGDEQDNNLGVAEEHIPQVNEESKTKKIKIASTKVEKKKIVVRPRKKVTPPKDEELVDTTQGVKVLWKSTRVKFRKDIDYKQVKNLIYCCRCEFVCKNTCTLRSHVKRIHFKIPPYRCSLCPKTFYTLAPFVMHKLDEHKIDERFKCNACDKSFCREVLLRKHKNEFHMLGVKVKCDLCDYECFNPMYIRRHMRVHNNEKNYHCQYCTKSFKANKTLSCHEKIHTGDKRKVCKECGQAFVQKASLNYHMAKYHPGVNF